MIKQFVVTDQNVDAYFEVTNIQGELLLDEFDADEFNAQENETFAVVTDMQCYRSGAKDVYGVRDGRVYVYDELQDAVVVLEQTVDECLEQLTKACSQ